MKNKQSPMLLIALTACIVSLSEAYGTNKFSQSFSSSSASSHASSYSSSSSYSYNGGQNPGQPAFIHEIPKANAIASASATAGFATATANATASAHGGGGAHLYSHGSGSGSYSVEGSNSGTAANSKENKGGISHPDPHLAHNTSPAIIAFNDGSKSVRHDYSSATANAHASAGSYSYSQSHGTPNVIGVGSHSDGGSSVVKNGPVLFKPAGNDYTSSDDYSSSKPSNSKEDNDQYNKGFNYQISPNKISNIGSLGSGIYSTDASQSIGNSNNHGVIRGGKNPSNQGYINSIGTSTLREDSSDSTVGHNAKETNNVFSGITHTNNNGKHNLASSQEIGGYSHANSGSYSSQSSSPSATQNNHVTIVSSTTAPSRGMLDKKGSGSHVEDGSYSAGDYNSPIDGSDSSYHQDKATNNQDFGSGSYSVRDSNTATNRGAGTHSSNKYIGGSYNIAGSGNVESGSSYTTTGPKGTGTGQNSYSFEKKYFHPVDETPTYQPNANGKGVNSNYKPHTYVFPGPDGSIYDYKVPSSQSNTGTSQSNVVQSGSYGGSQSVTSSANTIGTKQCCKGPFPGPSGSIHDSKPASAVGTGVKTTVSHPPLTRVTPKTPTINSFPGPTGSIYTSKPVVTNVDYNHQNNNQWSTSASSGTYQRQSGSSSPSLPLCTTSSPCTKAPQLTQQSTPSSYSKLPVVQYKPVNEIAKTAHKQNINTHFPSQYPIPSETFVDSYDDKREPQIQDNTKPNPQESKHAENSVTTLPEKTSNQHSGYSISEIESNMKNSFATAATHSKSTSTGSITSDAPTNVYSPIPNNYHGAPYFMVGKQQVSMFSKIPSVIIGDQKVYDEEKNKIFNHPVSSVGNTPNYDEKATDRELSTYKTGTVYKYNEKDKNSNTGSLISEPPYSVGTEINILPTHHESTASINLPYFQFHPVVGGNGQHAAKSKQNSIGSFSSHDTSSYSSNSKSSSLSGKTISGDSQVTFGDKPIDITTTIEKQVPNVYENSYQDIIIKPVDVSTTIEKQLPKVHTYGIPDTLVNPVAVQTDLEPEKPKTYTSSLYIDIKEPSRVINSDSIIFEKPTSFPVDKNTYHFVGSGSHGLGDQHRVIGSGIAFSSAGSNSYGSSATGYVGTAKHGCGIPSCKTSYRQYSNAVPLQVPKTPVIPIGTASSSGYLAGPGSGISAGNSGTSSQIGSGGFSSSGSYSGLFPKMHMSSDDGSGGFLSSIYIHDTPIHSAYADSHAKAGSFSTSKSYSKANSYASSSSFASSSSGSYSSHNY